MYYRILVSKRHATTGYGYIEPTIIKTDESVHSAVKTVRKYHSDELDDDTVIDWIECVECGTHCYEISEKIAMQIVTDTYIPCIVDRYHYYIVSDYAIDQLDKICEAYSIDLEKWSIKEIDLS